MLWMGIWVHPYTAIPVEVGAKFLKIGVWVNPNDVGVSWLRLQEASDSIPHPYWMYTMCFHTLICCGWAYGCTLTLILVQVGVNFGKLGGGGAQMTLGCHG
jgi:hypothetical protein